MNILAIVGSGRKGKATDVLVDQAIQGCQARHPDCQVQKIHLMDHRLEFCRNCLTCRDTETDGPYAPCVINDDMHPIYEQLAQADGLILGTPVHSGYVTGAMATFLERITWTFAKPEKKILTMERCPMPRTDKKRQAVIIVTSGIVPPILGFSCNWATGHIRGVIKHSLNAKTVGALYAGAVEHRGTETYLARAQSLGSRIGAASRRRRRGSKSQA